MLTGSINNFMRGPVVNHVGIGDERFYPSSPETEELCSRAIDILKDGCVYSVEELKKELCISNSRVHHLIESLTYRCSIAEETIDNKLYIFLV